MLMKLLLCEGITKNLFAPSACGLNQSLPRTRVEKHCSTHKIIHKYLDNSRARLTIGQTGQMPGASHLNMKTLIYWFFMLLGCSPRVEIVELCDY